jgi:ferric-dicitrate binding protein FerR (iron transport regulator)
LKWAGCFTIQTRQETGISTKVPTAIIMHEQHEHITRLFIRHFFNRTTPDEKKELENWAFSNKAQQAWYNQLMDRNWLANELQAYDAIDERAGLSKLRTLMDGVQPMTGRVRKGWRWKSFTVAAAVVLALVAGAGWWFMNNDKQQTGIIPGKENLAELQVVTTPVRQQQKIQLADGSIAWLNAGSSISYPAGFTGPERRVHMSGEVYFEIARNDRPFVVEVNGIVIKALGTRFNVNAYNNEAFIKATLLEGKLMVNRGNESAAMEPGQEASIGKAGKIGVLTVPNAEQVLAWKKGLFEFDNTDVPSVMRQLNHWYGVTVIYKADTPTTRITAIMNRSITIDQALKLLERNNGIHTEIHDNQITVLP